MFEFSDKDLIRFIEESKFFKILPKEEILQLYPKLIKVTIHAHQTLFLQGDTSDSLYLVIEGQLVAIFKNAMGLTINIGAINSGEIVGELGILSGEPRSLTVKAATDTYLLKLPDHAFRDLCAAYPKLIFEISNLVIARSLFNLKLLSTEKPTYNITIILPLTKDIPVTFLKDMFKTILNNYPVEFISDDELSFDQIKHHLQELQNKRHTLFLFMMDWKRNLFELCFDKSIHFYLILYEDEKIPSEFFNKMLFPSFVCHPNLRLELILFHSKETRHILNTRKFLELTKFHMHHHIRLNNDDDYARIGRFMTGNAQTLVLGGGGAKGFAHIGIIKAIQEKAIPIDAIGGASIGATVGACYASTLDIERTKVYLERLGRMAIKSIGLRGLTFPIISLFSGQDATKELIYLFDKMCIEDLPIPFFAVSSNLSENNEMIHSTGLIWPALRASASVPGIFPPVVIDGQLLFDGGLLNNLPVDVMRKMIGPDNVIIASCLSIKANAKIEYYFPPVLTLKQALLYRMGFRYKNFILPSFLETFRSTLLLGSSANERKNCLAANVLIKPDLSSYKMISKLKYNEEEELIELGYKEGRQALTNYFLMKSKSEI